MSVLFSLTKIDSFYGVTHSVTCSVRWREIPLNLLRLVQWKTLKNVLSLCWENLNRSIVDTCEKNRDILHQHYTIYRPCCQMYQKIEDTSKRQNDNRCLVNVESFIQNSQRKSCECVSISTFLNNFRHFRKKLSIHVNALYNAKKSC